MADLYKIKINGFSYYGSNVYTYSLFSKHLLQLHREENQKPCSSQFVGTVPGALTTYILREKIVGVIGCEPFKGPDFRTKLSVVIYRLKKQVTFET